MTSIASGTRATVPVDTPTYEQVIDGLLVTLAAAGALPTPVRDTPWESFIQLSELVHERFVIPSTTFTPIMRRLVFALGVAVHARSIAGVGTYVGYTFAWLARDRADPATGPHLDWAVGIDTDGKANELARANCAALGHGPRLQFVTEDGALAIAALPGPLDLLYLDLDDAVSGKAGYRRVLEAALPRLRPGAVVLAHDACLAKFAGDLDAYHRCLGESQVMTGPWLLPVDNCGLSLAVRRP